MSGNEENGRDLGGAACQSRGLKLIELIPGERYLVFFDADPDTLPDEDAIEELRLMAYMARRKPVLGPVEQIVEAAVLSVAETVSGNLISEAISERFPAARRFMRRWRERRKSAAPVTTEEAKEAAALAAQAVESSSTPPAAPSAVPLLEADIEVPAAEGGTVKVSVRAPGKWLKVTVETTGGFADVTAQS
jgi:hypothetical protein